MPRGHADASLGWQLVVVFSVAAFAAGMVASSVLPYALTEILHWIDNRTIDVEVAGDILGVSESQGTFTITGTLPADVAFLLDPGAVCTNCLFNQNGADIEAVPFGGVNGTFNLFVESTGGGAEFAVNGTNQVRSLVVTSSGAANATGFVSGNTVALHIDVPVSAVSTVQSIGAGAEFAVNGTNHVRSLVVTSSGIANATGVVSGDTIALHVDVPAAAGSTVQSVGAGVELAVNGTNHVRSLVVTSSGAVNATGFVSGDTVGLHIDVPSTPAALPLTGTGGVGTEQRANDTLVYTNAFSWITDPMPATAYISSYIFSSGSSSVTVWPPGMAGNTANNTMYKLDLAMNVYLTLNPFAAPNPDLGAVLMFTDIDNYFPDPVTNPYIDRFHSVGSASCAYNNGATPLELPFGGHGAHGNVNSYVFYFPMLDSGSYPVYTGRCEIRIEMWLESPGGGGLIEE